MKKIKRFLLCFAASVILCGNTFVPGQKIPINLGRNYAGQTNFNFKNSNFNFQFGQNDFLSSFEQQVLDEINAVRQSPGQYADYLEDIRKYYKDKYYTFPERQPILTIEGTVAIDDAVANLRKAVPSSVLKASEQIHLATADHLKDLLSGTKFGHRGSDGSMPDDRLARYMSLNSLRMGENVIKTKGSARDIILNMLIDDGFPSRAHRRNVLDPEFKFIGLSSGEINVGERFSVFIFTTAENPKKTTKSTNKTEEF